MRPGEPHRRQTAGQLSEPVSKTTPISLGVYFCEPDLCATSKTTEFEFIETRIPSEISRFRCSEQRTFHLYSIISKIIYIVGFSLQHLDIWTTSGQRLDNVWTTSGQRPDNVRTFPVRRQDTISDTFVYICFYF